MKYSLDEEFNLPYNPKNIFASLMVANSRAKILNSNQICNYYRSCGELNGNFNLKVKDNFYSVIEGLYDQVEIDLRCMAKIINDNPDFTADKIAVLIKFGFEKFRLGYYQPTNQFKYDVEGATVYNFISKFMLFDNNGLNSFKKIIERGEWLINNIIFLAKLLNCIPNSTCPAELPAQDVEFNLLACRVAVKFDHVQR